MAVQLQNALRSLAVLYGRTLQSCACSNTPRLLDRSGLWVLGMFLLLKVYPQKKKQEVSVQEQTKQRFIGGLAVGTQHLWYQKQQSLLLPHSN